MYFNSIVLIGAGGNGSWLALFLTQYMVFKESLVGCDFYIVDYDRFEDKNRARQFFARPGNKAESVVGTHTMRYEGVLRLHAIPKMVVSRSDYNEIRGVEKVPVDGLVKERSLIFLCVDAYYPRYVVSSFARNLKNICVVNGGTGEIDWDVSVYIRENGKDRTPNLLDIHPEISDLARAELQQLKREGVIRNEASCSNNNVDPQTLVSNVSTATLMFQVFVALLEHKLTIYSFEGSVLANQNGSWGPSLKSISVSSLTSDPSL